MPSPLCCARSSSGLALGLVMGMLGRLAAAGVPVIQNERGNDL